MPLQLVTIPCLADNYAYLIHDPDSAQTALVDAPEPGPILAALEAHRWRLTEILLTHHHDDHIQGVEVLRARTGARVLGAAADAHRLPRLDRALDEHSGLAVGSEFARVIDVPGHTLGHVAFHFPQSRLCFTADSLMAGG
ncbi:MAG: MBL fold metallo-hydrolase, partial [Tabrizicola sp.]